MMYPSSLVLLYNIVYPSVITRIGPDASSALFDAEMRLPGVSYGFVSVILLSISHPIFQRYVDTIPADC
jgi:hypothetical protein